MTETTAQGWRPEGWPTEEMLEAGQRCIKGIEQDKIHRCAAGVANAVFLDMIAAAPSAPAPSEDAVHMPQDTAVSQEVRSGASESAVERVAIALGQHFSLKSMFHTCGYGGIAIDRILDGLARAALSASAPQGAPPACAYCGTTKGLRKAGERPPDYICKQCFTPQDDGPCFDDLEPVEDAQ